MTTSVVDLDLPPGPIDRPAKKGKPAGRDAVLVKRVFPAAPKMPGKGGSRR